MKRRVPPPGREVVMGREKSLTERAEGNLKPSLHGSNSFPGMLEPSRPAGDVDAGQVSW